jgi:hypothetical protein
MTGVARGAVEAAEKALGIASPSKVFAEIGMQTGAGFEVGVDRAAPSAQASLESMISPPATSAGRSGGTPASSGGSSRSATISGNTFVFHGVQGMEDAETRFGELFTRLLEGDTADANA